MCLRGDRQRFQVASWRLGSLHHELRRHLISGRVQSSGLELTIFYFSPSFYLAGHFDRRCQGRLFHCEVPFDQCQTNEERFSGICCTFHCSMRKKINRITSGRCDHDIPASSQWSNLAITSASFFLVSSGCEFERTESFLMMVTSNVFLIQSSNGSQCSACKRSSCGG